MSESVTEVRPDGAESGVCHSCRVPVWWTSTAEGKPLALDVEPDKEGDVEMVLVGAEWRAEKLPQTESLFEVDRARWRAHTTTCSRSGTTRHGRVPTQRKP